MMESISQIAILVLMLSGVFFIFVAGVGLLRLPDLFCRSHALTKAMTLGISLLLLALFLDLEVNQYGLKIFLAIAFQFITIPISGHLLSLLAYRKNVPRWKERPIDEGKTEK